MAYQTAAGKPVRLKVTLIVEASNDMLAMDVEQQRRSHDAREGRLNVAPKRKPIALPPAPELAVPPLVSHRWHLPSLGEILDRMLPEWVPGKYPDFSGPDGHAKMRAAFEKFGDYLLSSLSFELEKAAGKGISQALELVRDPEYHKTVKRRTKKEIDKWNAERARQDRWRDRWKRCEFTQEERLQETGRIAYELQRHQGDIEKLKERQKLVESGQVLLEESLDTQPEAFKPRVIKNGGESDWPDTISFD